MSNLPTENNNPGDLREAGQANSSTGAGGFASFPNPQDGYAALANDIQAKMTAHPTWDLGQFASVYAPPSDNNDTASYTAKLANQLGVPPSTPISQLQGKMGQFVSAIANNEGYDGAQATQSSQGGEETSTNSSPSDTPWVDDALGIAGGLGATGLTAAALLQGGADVPNDVAAGAADAAIAPEAGGFLSGLWNKATGMIMPAIEGAVGGEVVNTAKNAVSGNSGDSTTGASAQPSGSSSPLPPSNESVSPEQGLPAPQTSSPIPQTPQELESQLPQASQASQTVAQAQNQALQSTPTGRVLAQEQATQEGLMSNGRYGISPLVDENGNFDSSDALEKSNKTVGELDDGVTKVLQAEGASGNINDALQGAKENIEKYAPVPDQEDAMNHVQTLLDAYKNKYADEEGNMPLFRFQEMKKEMGRDFDKTDTNAKTAAKKALSAGARKTIEKNTYHKDFYNKVNKEEENLIKGREVLERLNGKKAPKSSNFIRDLIKQGGGALGIYLGDKIGGPLGAILGNMVGEKISRAADKRHGRNVFETKGMKAAMAELEKKSPAVYKVLQREIQNAEERVKYKKAEEKGEKPQENNKEVKKEISGKSMGFPAKEEKTPPSEKLKALMQRETLPSAGLKNLMKPLPMSKRKGQIKALQNNVKRMKK